MATCKWGKRIILIGYDNVEIDEEGQKLKTRFRAAMIVTSLPKGILEKAESYSSVSQETLTCLVHKPVQIAFYRLWITYIKYG